MAEPQAVGLSAQAMLAHIAGRFDDAERLYAEACTHLERHGSPHAAGFGVLATVTIRASQHRLAEFAPAAAALHEQYGPIAVDAAAAALAAAGRHDQARAVLRDPPPLRPDFYFSVFATLRAMAVVAIGDRELAEELYAALLPVAGPTRRRGEHLAGDAAGRAHPRRTGPRCSGGPPPPPSTSPPPSAVAGAWQAPVWQADARRALAAVRADRA